MTEDWRRNLRFRCTGCGKCCRETVVLITDVDVQRIIDSGRNLRATDIVRFFKPEELQMSRRHPFWIRFDSGPAVMGLRWRNGSCRFLEADGLCSVYQDRPVTCREYPFNVVREGTRAVDVRIEHVVDCPGEMDGRNLLREVKQTVVWNEVQSAAFVAKVRRWNRGRQQPKNRPAFLRFVGLDA